MEVHMGKTTLISPQRLRDAHTVSFPMESVSCDGHGFTARCVACGIGPCVATGPTSPAALGHLECPAGLRDAAAQGSAT